VELTEYGRTIAPIVAPPEDDSKIQSKLFELLLKTPSKTQMPPESKIRVIFNQLLDGKFHTKESLADKAGYTCVGTKAFRNILPRMLQLGMLERGPSKESYRFTDMVLAVGGRPNQSTPRATQRTTVIDTNINHAEETDMGSVPVNDVSNSNGPPREQPAHHDSTSGVTAMPALRPNTGSSLAQKRVAATSLETNPQKKPCPGFFQSSLATGATIPIVDPGNQHQLAKH
jgi:hypothetical protein